MMLLENRTIKNASLKMRTAGPPTYLLRGDSQKMVSKQKLGADRNQDASGEQAVTETGLCVSRREGHCRSKESKEAGPEEQCERSDREHRNYESYEPMAFTLIGQYRRVA